VKGFEGVSNFILNRFATNDFAYGHYPRKDFVINASVLSRSPAFSKKRYLFSPCIIGSN
jgi:hypothetical protein